ncbi:hypothetical protein EOPP23_19300 [Endozoicomonas sp. OPT23]|uniref:hypothetical protein n=1 Tax=Endozoicomonas sp. OPT23 TaxID=2072845 RepID=UPI00129B4FAB|nr:hypothetical protein [Endozoicomonas sp. OPT23]MRI35116.1 hypothetical protein [Endozoicomonas sp. OPT23]
MYTDEDLNRAVREGIFSTDSVEAFRDYLSSERSDSDKNVAEQEFPAVDEENFRLISGFNDIFVVIASLLFLLSSSWVLSSYSQTASALSLTVLSWGLAEIFVARRKMALPAIMLLLSFGAGVFLSVFSLFEQLNETTVTVSALVTMGAIWLHWKRFMVPVTVAAGMATLVVFMISLSVWVLPQLLEWLSPLIFAGGCLVFSVAMYWDASDPARTTRRSDSAFWLHLLSAPMLVHPVFVNLGMFKDQESLQSLLVAVALYLLMTLISLIIDRRAFMVSSLIYVLYALSSFFETYGYVSYSFALTGIVIGSALLLLSAFWHPVRTLIVKSLPVSLRQHLPVIQ